MDEKKNFSIKKFILNSFIHFVYNLHNGLSEINLIGALNFQKEPT